ncbi:MAG: hypothetical protein ACT4PG_12400 [Panacagrimonas sp.]
MKNPTAIEQLQSKLDQARAERDAWRGKSAHHFEMASKLVVAMEAELKRAIEAEQYQR